MNQYECLLLHPRPVMPQHSSPHRRPALRSVNLSYSSGSSLSEVQDIDLIRSNAGNPMIKDYSFFQSQEVLDLSDLIDRLD